MSAVSRRAVLGALGATALAGCSRIRNGMRDVGVGCADVPLSQRFPFPWRDVGRISFGIVPTRRVRGILSYALMTPDGVDPRSITRVVYVLPGRGGFARDALTWTGYAAEAQRLARAGTPPFALLAIDSGDSYFHLRESGEDRLGVLEEDLPAFTHKLLAQSRVHHALVGQSMGGYGALLAAERGPQRYRAVAVAGPALFRSYDEERHAVGDAFDNAKQFAQYDVFAGAAKLADVPTMIRIGYDDPFLANVEAFAKLVPTADVGYIEHGCHDIGLWRVTAPALIGFVAAHLAPG